MDIVAFREIPTFTGLPAHPFLNRIAMYVVPTASVALAATALTVMTAHSGSKSVYLEDGEIMTGKTPAEIVPASEATEPSGG
jgi:hypothetical protein